MMRNSASRKPPRPARAECGPDSDCLEDADKEPGTPSPGRDIRDGCRADSDSLACGGTGRPLDRQTSGPWRPLAARPCRGSHPVRAGPAPPPAEAPSFDGRRPPGGGVRVAPSLAGRAAYKRTAVPAGGAAEASETATAVLGSDWKRRLGAPADDGSADPRRGGQREGERERERGRERGREREGERERGERREGEGERFGAGGETRRAGRPCAHGAGLLRLGRAHCTHAD